MGEDFHKTILENQHRTFTQVHRQTQKSREKSRRLINQNRAEVSLKVGDAVYLRNHQRSSKLDSKWKPYFRITKQKSPTTFMIRNQLDGTERKAHANHLAKAPVGEWEVPLPLEARRPVRRRQLVIAPDSDESDSGDSEEEVETREIGPRDRAKRQERDGSDTEDDIPLAELRERLTGREQRQVDLIAPRSRGRQVHIVKARGCRSMSC
jgi:hypothetical protein